MVVVVRPGLVTAVVAVGGEKGRRVLLEQVMSVRVLRVIRVIVAGEAGVDT